MDGNVIPGDEVAQNVAYNWKNRRHDLMYREVRTAGEIVLNACGTVEVWKQDWVLNARSGIDEVWPQVIDVGGACKIIYGDYG